MTSRLSMRLSVWGCGQLGASEDGPNFLTRPALYRARRKVWAHRSGRVACSLLEIKPVAYFCRSAATPAAMKHALVAHEAEARLSTFDGGWPGRTGMVAAVRRIDAQRHTTALRHTGAASLAFGNCGRKPSLAANQKLAVVASVKLRRVNGRACAPPQFPLSSPTVPPQFPLTVPPHFPLIFCRELRIHGEEKRE